MKLGRFELQRVLGEGAEATVWLGFEARLEREVAVELMRGDAAAGLRHRRAAARTR